MIEYDYTKGERYRGWERRYLSFSVFRNGLYSVFVNLFILCMAAKCSKAQFATPVSRQLVVTRIRGEENTIEVAEFHIVLHLCLSQLAHEGFSLGGLTETSFRPENQ
jgi:hypothetical protein